jgi:hypothetical protein
MLCRPQLVAAGQGPALRVSRVDGAAWTEVASINDAHKVPPHPLLPLSSAHGWQTRGLRRTLKSVPGQSRGADLLSVCVDEGCV